MRIFIILIFGLSSFHLTYSQTKNFEEIDPYPLQFENLSKFKLLHSVQSLEFQFQQNISNYNILRIDSTFDFNSVELNKKLFSNFKVVDNTYVDFTEYLRGCGPLNDGISNNVNSRDLMLSIFLDNLVNNYIFNGKGVFFKR